MNATHLRYRAKSRKAERSVRRDKRDSFVALVRETEAGVDRNDFRSVVVVNLSKKQNTSPRL